MEADSGDGENGQENSAPAFGDLVTMSTRHFLDEAMASEHAELPTDSHRGHSFLIRLLPFG
jgi:hypothetical protein